KKLKELFLTNNNNIINETKEKIENNKKRISELNEFLEQFKDDKNAFKNKDYENSTIELKKLNNEFYKGFIKGQ
ncbi:MAG: hypothetical protein IKI11_02285, partial [Neisseriaceae bacterium]|nr:hypothetical protein [Neisseriaceae bacterium]